MLDLKTIKIGSLIEVKWKEMKISMERTCNFLSCTENEVKTMFISDSLDTEILLRWSKLLQYDFFRFYSQHLILYSPPVGPDYHKTSSEKKSLLPQFKKNIYTREIIEFILEMISSGRKTKQQIIDEYRIPKTTLYKWISKYSIPS